VNGVVQGVLLAVDQIVSVAGDGDNPHHDVDTTLCQNGTASHDYVESSSTVSRVRLVQFDKNTADPLVSLLTHWSVIGSTGQ